MIFHSLALGPLAGDLARFGAILALGATPPEKTREIEKLRDCGPFGAGVGFEFRAETGKANEKRKGADMLEFHAHRDALRILMGAWDVAHSDRRYGLNLTALEYLRHAIAYLRG